MNIVVVGLSHKTASVEIREKIAFAPTQMEKPLRMLIAIDDIAEAVIVSTCNRVELYASTRDVAGGMARLKRFLGDYHGVPVEVLEPHLYSHHGEAAIRHVFRVAASLDSMVVGEPQILGQIKTAYGYAAEFRTSGIILNRFLHKAFSVAKRVRTETKIASSAVSVSFAAVELARKIFGDLSDKTVMLIGAGEMCELAAKHFLNNGARGVMVTNRTYERAERLAEEFEGKAIHFEDLFDQLHKADIVLSSTGATHYIIRPKDIDEVIRRRKMKPMFFIDIAVPRDIDPKVNDVENVYLYDMDDLQNVVASNLQQRAEEAKKAEGIIEEEIGQFYKWISSLEVTPTIVALRSKFEDVRRAELEKTLSAWKDLPPDGAKRLEALTAAIVNKLLHPPTATLKRTGQGGRTDLYVDALRTLFDLQTELPEPEGSLELEE
ncbi:glutamyl-tRNA reductase [Geobacter sulfurreducens]|jgi:glutamyl-tRNA reductase|uniref:Glutamyl-tRNA reductase n=1 Tax=Geobacter sulfurreducens (strain ATCC 51573 / DSM 12127 / PCA) TaxID=243231 RepID=HEM1_GEOSL|nr:glutamyl-tRNA reductase [Geobacter sulfurreducens]Q747I2.1 RecName: Full=Glutamyl-tRNA reductase; Short=GluTR [Geobacter sulfurreducens PCA]BET59650.1 glutamyl-tRNA reductase [Geobacter sp. 60473]AAR36674.1 glutamyl-tRNA reductase [Geobacter sulfurreducens PCA]ADI86036.1 glutamyl-tRNA reductase [Geobacter sulfurreducens KN400]AJY69512.1 glutamyl-tRNA reductase [Geobacter sulfurreducens]QVW35069.1 glutamyl-tRNA reductase [Geobacter sulfurreducens]